MNITENLIRQCSLTLGQFDSERTDLLVTLFHHQNSCPELTRLSYDLKKKFEDLLTSKRDDDEVYNYKPLTRIELAIMIVFKRKYLSEPIVDDDQNQLKSNRKFSIDDELNLAYCFLLAQTDDYLEYEDLDNLKFFFNIEESIQSLFNIYEKLQENFSNFFSLLIQSNYFVKRKVIAGEFIQGFQLFIQRYEDFIITFDKYYKPLIDNYTQTDALSNLNDTQKIMPLIPIPKIREPSISTPDKQSPKASVSRTVSVSSNASSSSSSLSSSSSNIPRKSLCVIINIKELMSSQSIDTHKRAGSDKDVELIKFVFTKLKYTVLQCQFDFKKKNLNDALDYIDDKNEFGDFDCLVMFIMSHGLLHSFFTADSEEIIIRDIVKRYADSSSTTIWKRKPRMFFIQACRSLWPTDLQTKNREGVKLNDLSPQMLVAYSCSAAEISKRSPTVGSIFIQILCMMILRYGHFYAIQHILDCTAKFVMKRDEIYSEHRKKQIEIQKPEYIQREFSSKFRFSETCVFNKYHSWVFDEQSILYIPFAIWQEIYNRINEKFIINHN